MSFEAEFFGPGNRLRWEAIQANSLSPEIQQRLGPFLEDLRRNPQVLALPCVRDDGRVQWYVVCQSPRATRVARDEVRAFLGPTYSDFDGKPKPLDPSDPVEAAILAKYGENAFRLAIGNRQILDAARERLRLMIQVQAERPTRYAKRIRAVGRILRDFEYALLAADGVTAKECIEELRAAGKLSASNLLFLEIRRLTAFENSDGVLALPELDAILAIARPRRVTEALVRAVYRSRLRGFEEENRPAEAVALFRSEIIDRFRDLYRSRANLAGWEVDASFLMVAVESNDGRGEAITATLERYPAGSVQRGYLEAIAEQIAPSGPVPHSELLATARAAFAKADVDQAYDLSIKLPPSFDRSALLLRCARDMGSLSAAQVAIESLDALAEEDRKRLDQHLVLGRIRDSLTQLSAIDAAGAPEATVAADIPTDWITWLRRLTAPEPWKAAVSIAETAAREWTLVSLLENSSAVQRIADLLLAQRPEWGQTALQDALPFFLEFFERSATDARLRPIYESLFLTVALDAYVSIPQILALLKIASARLDFGISAQEYSETLRILSSAIQGIESPAVTESALDALEMLIGAACPDVHERQQFFLSVATVFRRWYRRIDAAQFALLRSLGEEIGVSDGIFEEEPASNSEDASTIWTSLSGKKVAIYSLQESALRRTASVLRKLCPGVRVDTFHDHVGGSPSLRAASSTSDIFVLAIGSAKHAATGFIEDRRPKGLVTLYARGQGSAGMLHALGQYLAVGG
uniref:Uncharacterized protein n=1 Tax=mine drainage metagenome TaxID=410659 RepID=E6PXS3_9ZZZZ